MAGGTRVSPAGQMPDTIKGVHAALDRYGFPPTAPERGQMLHHAGVVLARGGTAADAVAAVERVLANTYGPPAGEEGPPLEGPDGTLGL